jgi:hypothetical protein
MTLALCLEQITAWGLSPLDLVHLGAALGCAAVSLCVQSPTPHLPDFFGSLCRDGKLGDTA